MTSEDQRFKRTLLQLGVLVVVTFVLLGWVVQQKIQHDLVQRAQHFTDHALP